MARIIYIVLILLTTKVASYSQVNDRHIRLRVLQYKMVGKDYKFIDKIDHTETHLKYLGRIKTKNGAEYKILTSIWLWGYSHRATSRILVYNAKNQYLGQYYVGMTYDLPNYIKNGQLVFLNSDNINSGCDLSLITNIDLSNGPPKDIFVNCKGTRGDIFSFSRE